MEEPELDEDEYPTDETLEWEFSQEHQWNDLMNFVKKAWYWPDYVSIKEIKSRLE